MLKPGALGLADLLELMEHQAQQGAVGIRLCLCSSLHKTETSLIPLPKTRSAKGEGLFLQLQREGVKSPKCVHPLLGGFCISVLLYEVLDTKADTFPAHFPL